MTVPAFVRGTECWLRVVAFAIGVGVVTHAHPRQVPAPPSVPEPSVSELGTTETEEPGFRAGITLVTTDVIVRDGNGTFIADLDADEFIVREDGVVQDVVSLVLVHGGRVFNQLAPAPAVQ